MIELETKQSKLTVQLNVAKEDVVKVNRDEIVAYLEMLRQGNVNDRDFQSELFKNFLVAAYLYDSNRMKLVFSFTGKDNSVEIPLETGEDPPDGADPPDAKMFVLPLECSTRKKKHYTEMCGAFLLHRHGKRRELPTKGKVPAFDDYRMSQP